MVVSYVPVNNGVAMNNINSYCSKSECYQEGSKWVCECIRNPVEFKEVLIIILFTLLLIFICLSPLIYMEYKDKYGKD